MDDNTAKFLRTCQKLVPSIQSLTNKIHPVSTSVGVFGGCAEYTGAPYFAAISALKTGADVVHLFCTKEAAPIIKSYTPDLVIHPHLDDADAMKKIKPWLDKLQAILVGPGLGRDPEIFDVIDKVVQLCKVKRKLLVIDSDGLYYLSQEMHAIKHYPQPGVVLTPNAIEFAKLFGIDEIPEKDTNKRIHFFDELELGDYVTIIKKGSVDEIFDSQRSIKVAEGGTGRRCGNQGDILAGSLATFLVWAFKHRRELELYHDDRAMIACYAACRLTRECNSAAFEKKKRSMIGTDMVAEIGTVFKKCFDDKRLFW